MITLKNVSKYYYSKGLITSGFTKVNLALNIGEFVAITGESGSGKSTLLNVISGLDSYEEGEMYIAGQETSHYTEKDFEEYRRKYISNIFQNFNLVNSYTTLQNIELVLLINGDSQKQARAKALKLIKKVGLSQYKNTKVSKLSGGQKQRVSIARALAKETPIIIADEPTGSLDSKTAKEIIKLLNDISKEKLVIIVTHNYSQVESFVTRKITMHDGRILEDKQIETPPKLLPQVEDNINHLKLGSKIRLGIRNAFNIFPKFFLVFLVYLFIVTAVITEYAFFRRQEYISSKDGYNHYFQDATDTRLILKKKDHTAFSEEDYQNLDQIKEVDYIVKNDLLLDHTISLQDGNNFYFDGRLHDIATLEGKPDLGRLPEIASEILIADSPDSYYFSNFAQEILNKEVYLTDMYGNENKDKKLTIVGIVYEETNNYYYSNGKIYASSNILDELKFSIHSQYSNLKVLFQNKYHHSYHYDIHYQVIPNSKVPSGSVIISSDLNYLCKNNNCLAQPLTIEVDNLYYQDSLNLKVTNTYTKKNIESLLGVKDYETYNGAIFVNTNDYNQLFNKGNYQSSVFLKDVQTLDSTSHILDTRGYEVLKIKDTKITGGVVEVLKIIRTVVTAILVITLFFISYFVIRIILKSRNIYFGTIRILGATRKEAKQLLEIELFTVANIAYFTFISLLILYNQNLITINFLTTILKYLNLFDYILLYLIIMAMSYLISLRFSKKVFQKSAMTTMREEV